MLEVRIVEDAHERRAPIPLLLLLLLLKAPRRRRRRTRGEKVPLAAACRSVSHWLGGYGAPRASRQ